MKDDAHVKRILSTFLFRLLQYIQIYMALLCLNIMMIVYLHVYLRHCTTKLKLWKWAISGYYVCFFDVQNGHFKKNCEVFISLICFLIYDGFILIVNVKNAIIK